MIDPWLAGAGLCTAGGLALRQIVRSRNMQYWLGSYLRQQIRSLPRRRPAFRHVYFCLVDHFEPYGATKEMCLARAKTARWLERYGELARRHTDSDGNHPKHSFFYPAEEYDEELVDLLAAACRRGFGDVEVHLHHQNDTHENLRATLESYVSILHRRHGLLRPDPENGGLAYCFVHGNWALDNSRPDGGWCGVDNEIDILIETGCYADMTMPSAPSDTQTRKINSIYFARGRPGMRKSHDSGRDLKTGGWAHPGELLMVQGPLSLNWRERRFGLIPRIESGELSFDAPPTAHRVASWGRCAIGIEGAEEHVFIKVHTHGATDRSMRILFEGGFETLWTQLERQYRDKGGCALHYVTAWELCMKLRDLSQPREQQACRTA